MFTFQYKKKTIKNKPKVIEKSKFRNEGLNKNTIAVKCCTNLNKTSLKLRLA